MLKCGDKWCGVTYKEDRESVQNELQAKKDKAYQDSMQTVYIIPAANGCLVAAAHYTVESAEGFGARFDRDGGFLDVCTYVDGKRNGKSVSFDEDGNIVVRLWSNGEMISEKIIAD